MFMLPSYPGHSVWLSINGNVIGRHVYKLSSHLCEWFQLCLTQKVSIVLKLSGKNICSLKSQEFWLGFGTNELPECDKISLVLLPDTQASL